MNNNKKLSKKVRHVFPLALAAALTVSGTGITTSAQTIANHSIIRQAMVVAAAKTVPVTITETDKKVSIEATKVVVGSNSYDVTTNDIVEITTDGKEVDGAEIEFKGAPDVVVKLKNFKAKGTTACLSFSSGSSAAKLALEGTNKIETLGTAGTNDVTVTSGKGSLELGAITVQKLEVNSGFVKIGKVTGNFTMDGDVVVSRTEQATGTDTLTAGVVYTNGVGTVYNDPEVEVPAELADKPLGAKLAEGDVTVGNVVYTGEDAKFIPSVTVTKHVFGNSPKTFIRDTDYTVDFKAGVDKKTIGVKTVEFKAKDGRGLIFPADTYEKTFNVTAMSFDDAKVTLDKTSFTYDKKEHQVTPTVKLGEKTLADTDYELDGSGKDKATNAGEYTVKVKGKGNYATTPVKEVKWTIDPVKLKLAKDKEGRTELVLTKKDYDGNKTLVSANIAATFAGILKDDTLNKGTDYNLVGEFDDENVGKDKKVTIKYVGVTDLGKNYTMDPVTINAGEIAAKAPAKPDAAPVLKDNTYTVSEKDPDTFMAELVATPGYEYKMDDGKWQRSNMFDRITPGTHKFYARVADTKGNPASDASDALEKLFNKLPNDKLIALTYRIVKGTKPNTKKIIIDPVKGAMYKFGNGAGDKFTNSNVKDDLNAVASYPVSIKYAETKTLEESATVSENVDLTKDTLDIAAPELKYTNASTNTSKKVKYTISTPTKKLDAGYKYQYYVDGAWSDGVGAVEGMLGSKHILGIRVVDASGNMSPATTKEVEFAKVKTPKLRLEYKVVPGTTKGTRKITITPNAATELEGIKGEVEYSVDGAAFGKLSDNANVKDNIRSIVVLLKVRFAPSSAEANYHADNYEIVETTKTLSFVANNGVAGGNGNVVKDNTKKDETKKPEDKKDTKKDETKKPEDKKDNTNTDNKTADTSKAIKDAVKKSTKTGSVTLKSVGSGLEKAVGGNTSKLSVSLNKSKTKSTSKAVTKKLGKSKLVTKTVYSFNIKNGSKNLTDKQVSGSKIKVTLKVSLGNKNRTVYVMDVSTGKKVKAKYNAKTKKLTFTTNYVGDFVIVK